MKNQTKPPNSGQYFSYYVRRVYDPPVVLLTLLQLVLPILLFVLKLPWLKWVDPHLIQCMVTIIQCFDIATQILVFLQQHIPKRLFKIGSSKDHLIGIDFERCFISSIYLCKVCNQASKDDGVKVYYGIKRKGKTILLVYNSSTTAYALSISFKDRWVRSKLGHIIFIIKLLLKFILLVVNISSKAS